MKKIILLAAVAGLALASCTKDLGVDVKPEASEIELSFETPIVTPATKAGEVIQTTIFPTSRSIAVAAVHSDPTYTAWPADPAGLYMPVTIFSHDVTLNTWKSAGKKYYWPKTGKLTFQGYYPTDGFSIGEAGVTATGYTVAVDGTQKDFMFSDRKANQTKVDDADHAGTYHGVQLNFRHGLSALIFTVKTQDEYTGTTIKLKGIELLGVRNQGDFTQGISGAAETGTPLWTVNEEAATVSYSNIVAEDADITVDNTIKNLWTNSKVNDLLVLPQSFVTNTDAKLKITYTMKPEDGAEVTQTHEAVLKDLIYTINEATDDSKSFKIGHKYQFNIVIALDEIHISPQVTDWTTVTITETIQ